MHIVKHKLHTVMRSYHSELPKDKLQRNREEYHQEYLKSIDSDESMEEAETSFPAEEDIMFESKLYQSVPNRKNIKTLSGRIVEENLRKDE